MENSNFGKTPSSEEKLGQSSVTSEVTFKIIEHIAMLNTNTRGWTTELNLVSWNGKPAKYEIRDWNPDHTRGGKGLTFEPQVWENLKQIIRQMN